MRDYAFPFPPLPPFSYCGHHRGGGLRCGPALLCVPHLIHDLHLLQHRAGRCGASVGLVWGLSGELVNSAVLSMIARVSSSPKQLRHPFSGKCGQLSLFPLLDVLCYWVRCQGVDWCGVWVWGMEYMSSQGSHPSSLPPLVSLRFTPGPHTSKVWQPDRGRPDVLVLRGLWPAPRVPPEAHVVQVHPSHGGKCGEVWLVRAGIMGSNHGV